MNLAKIFSIFKNLSIRSFSIKFETCQLCNWRLLVKTHDDEM